MVDHYASLSFPCLFHCAKIMASAHPTPGPPWAEVDPTSRRHGEDQECGALPPPLESLDRDNRIATYYPAMPVLNE